MAGEVAGPGPQETIGVSIVFRDEGTPVVQRHVAEVRKGLGEVEAASKRTGETVAATTAKTGTAMRETAAATGSVTQGMAKAQQVAFGLAGGLSGIGAQAARVTGALATLASTGFHPLGIAIALVATGVGALVSKHQEEAAAAREHAAAERDVLAAAQAAQIAVRARFDPGAEAKALQDRIRGLDLKIAGEREAQEKFRIGVVPGARGELRSTGAGPLVEAQKREEALWIERMRLYNELAKIQGMARADEAQRAARFSVTRRGFSPGEGVSWDGFPARDLIGDDRALESPSLGDSPFDGMTPFYDGAPGHRGTVGDDPFQRGNPTANDPMVLDALYGDGRYNVAGRKDRSTPFYEAGTRAGDGFLAGIGDTLSTGVLTGRLEIRDLSKSMADLFVRSFVDALVQASIGDTMRAGFQSLFRGLGGALGFSGGTSDANVQPFNVGGVGARGPGITVIADVPPSVVVAEDVARAMPKRTARALVVSNLQGPGRRGNRA